MLAHVQFEVARVAIVAALAQKHAEQRVDMGVAVGVGKCIEAARSALAKSVLLRVSHSKLQRSVGFSVGRAHARVGAASGKFRGHCRGHNTTEH